MKTCNLFVLFFLPLCLCSCGNTDTSKRIIFLSGKFKLAYAVINKDYFLDKEPAYFNSIPNCVNCISDFDKENTYIIYNVKIVDGKPIGYGSFNISFADKTLADRKCEYFEYICYYDMAYGGEIRQTDYYGIEYVGKQYCRGHYWWARMECWLPEISNDRIILEFTIDEYFDEPGVFDYKINL